MKKLLPAALLLSAVVAASAVPAAAETVSGNVCIGDVDADGVISISDVTALQYFLAQHLAPSSEEHRRIMDADGDGSVTISDATELQRCIAELPHADRIGKPMDEVYPQAVPTSLSLHTDAVTLGVTETFPLQVSADAPLPEAPRFASGKPSVAAVSDDGVVTAVQPGSATVTCTVGDLTAVCKVTVRPLAQALAPNRLRVTVETGSTYPMVIHLPGGTAAYERRYFSEDAAVATVDSEGVITAVSAGVTRIGCELRSGACAYMTVTVTHPLRSAMLACLQNQLGNDMHPYIDYINAHSALDVPDDFPWCAIFAWSTLDSVAAATGRNNPVAAGKQVSDLANQARTRGALHNIYDNDYTPKPGDLFTTPTLDRPGDDGREHIGYIESVDTDENGRVVRMHTIEGNYNWETLYSNETRVSRGERVPGERDIYGAALVEYIDLEQLFAP